MRTGLAETSPEAKESVKTGRWKKDASGELIYIPHPDEIAYLKNAWAEQQAHRHTLFDKVREATKNSDSKAGMAALNEILKYDDSLYPCIHGRSLWKDCVPCEVAHLMIYENKTAEQANDAILNGEVEGTLG